MQGSEKKKTFLTFLLFFLLLHSIFFLVIIIDMIKDQKIQISQPISPSNWVT